MPGRIEGYAIVGDLQTAALAGADGSGLAVLLPLRLTGLLRRPARRRYSRPLADRPRVGRALREATLQGSHAPPGDGVGDPERCRQDG